MLFVRCKGGFSHHPEESVTAEDVQIGLDVMIDFLLKLESEPAAPARKAATIERRQLQLNSIS